MSFVVKERLFLAESLVATSIGIAFGPLAAGALNPFIFPNIQQVTYDFSQIVICIQIMAAAIALPKYVCAIAATSVI